MTKDHPCPWPQAALDILDQLLPSEGLILDPFAGIGMIHQLATGGRLITGVELEPEWAGRHPNTLVGDATALDFRDGQFDAVATSPAFGNRMADQYAGERCLECGGEGSVPVPFNAPCANCDGTGRFVRSRRHTYRLALGREMTEGNGAAMQWGGAYRALHAAAVGEIARVLKPGGLLLLDMKDHSRAYVHQRVTDWWISTCALNGLRLMYKYPVPTEGLPHSGPDPSFHQEHILVFRKRSM